MKKTIILIVLVSFLFGYCSENNITENSEEKGLNFYLLKDSTITASEIFNKNVNDLKLAEKPFLTYKDMGYYNWTEHTFTIDSNKSNVIGCICKNNITVSGIPFIVTVDQERIYMGAFWFMHSSLAPFCPHIDAIFNYEKNPEVLTINKSWNGTEADLRNDQRIYNTLKKYGLLVE